MSVIERMAACYAVRNADALTNRLSGGSTGVATGTKEHANTGAPSPLMSFSLFPAQQLHLRHAAQNVTAPQASATSR